MGSRLLNTNHSSLSFRSSNSLFPSPYRALFPPNSLSFPFRFISPRGFNICWVLRRPIIAAYAHRCCALDGNEYYEEVAGEPLVCPLEWWEGRENDDISQIYDAWCEEYGKKFPSEKEMLRAFSVFLDNYYYVRQHNKHSNTCSSLGINEFSDLTEVNHGYVENCNNSIEFWNEQLAKGQGNNKLIVVVFTSQWSRLCELMDPSLNEFAHTLPEVTFLNVDMIRDYELKPLFEKWEVETVPTFMFMKNGEVVDKFVGFVTQEQLQRKIAKHATVAAAASP